MYTPVLIVGTGIAGLSVAYNLKKQGMDFLMLTKAEQIYASNSVMAPANIRMFEDVNSGIDLYMKECNGNHEMIKEIYSNQDFLTEMLKELKIKYRKTPIGIIPDEITSATGGSYLIRKLSANIETIRNNTNLVDIKIHDKYVSCLVFDKSNNQFYQINCSVLVVATGGFASLFKFNDNSRTATGECTYLLQRETDKLQGASTIMFHPFGINGGKRVLVGDVVSLLDKIYEKDGSGKLKELEISPEMADAIKNNKYHSNYMFSQIIKCFKNKEIYLYYDDEEEAKTKLVEYGYSDKIIRDNLIRIYLTAHYTSGGIEVGKDFKVLDNVYACGEVLFDGNKGIGRLPGHPFASAIISSKIIADEIVKNKEEYEEHNEEEVFAVQELLSRDEKDNLENNKKIFNNFATKIEEVLYNEVQIDEKKKLDDELINFLNKLKNNMKCIEELEIYYRLELLREVLKK